MAGNRSPSPCVGLNRIIRFGKDWLSDLVVADSGTSCVFVSVIMFVNLLVTRHIEVAIALFDDIRIV
jgi:hypothetical protein